ncbi:MAG: hypothetical protein HQ538_01765 [Parcubacteria group bacterium]|nr:hypothetical protein [Parcubacteria group bacterium]
MSKFLINNAKPNVVYKGTPEWKRMVELPLDKRDKPIELPYEQEQKRQGYLKLGEKAKFGEAIEIPANIESFECGDPEYTIDPKNPKKTIVDTSSIRKYPGIPMGEIFEFENEMDAIWAMENWAILDEVEKQEIPILDTDKKETGKTKEGWVIVKKGQEGVKYPKLVGEEKTKQILEEQQLKWEARVRQAEKSGIV